MPHRNVTSKSGLKHNFSLSVSSESINILCVLKLASWLRNKMHPSKKHQVKAETVPGLNPVREPVFLLITSFKLSVAVDIIIFFPPVISVSCSV